MQRGGKSFGGTLDYRGFPIRKPQAARRTSNSHFKRSPKKGDVEVEEAMVALSGIGRLDVEALEHETKQVIPVIKREVLDQGPQVLEESAP